jgi:hypothetical protein
MKDVVLLDGRQSFMWDARVRVSLGAGVFCLTVMTPITNHTCLNAVTTPTTVAESEMFFLHFFNGPSFSPNEPRFCTQTIITGISPDLIDKIPGRPNDRRTPLGELNWIFTAITDTIAWNILPQKLFQKLFREDLLVASLFRNYLLAERIMRSCKVLKGVSYFIGLSVHAYFFP